MLMNGNSIFRTSYGLNIIRFQMGRIVQKMTKGLKKTFQSVRHKRRLYYSRKAAKRNLAIIQDEQQRKVVTPKLKATIKKYAKSRYGSSGYWPWLAVYTELRGEFMEGWVPDDLFSYSLLPCFNPESITELSICKTFDHRLFPGMTIEPVAVVLNCCCFGHDFTPLSREAFTGLMKGLGDKELVVKREDAPSGSEIRFAPAREIKIDWFDTGENYVLQPAVQQHSELARLHPSSVATLRITTFLRSDGVVEVKHRSLRYGTGSSKVVNSSGMFSFIDRDGNVSSNIRSRIGTDLGPTHPDTGVRLPGFNIPGLKKGVDLCKAAHYNIPHLRFIAWDIYIDTEGDPHIIEWNTVFPGMWENDALIGPLWSEEDIDEVLEWQRR